MKPIYIITRYNEHGKVRWERLSRNKHGYYSTIGSINSWPLHPNDEVTLEKVTGYGTTMINRYFNGAEVVTP